MAGYTPKLGAESAHKDLKKHNQCHFYLISQDKDNIVRGNYCCLLGEKIKRGAALSMMTANTLGIIAAQNLD